jgi:hypothetical protein
VSVLEALQHTVDSGGRLQRVVAYHFEGDLSFVTHLALEFELGRLVLSAGEEFDEILASTDLPSTPDNARETPAWTPACGRPLLWAWTLTNHQGYVDGVRFDFRDTVSQSAVIFEVIVVASTLYTTVVPGAV